MSRSSPRRSCSFDNGDPDATARASAAIRASAKPSAAANITGRRGKNDWQLSLERAFNSLDQKGGLFDPQSGRRVRAKSLSRKAPARSQEVRYESIATLSRPLTSNLDLQVAAGAEISHLDRVDDDLPAAQILPAQGQRHARLAPGQGLGREPQAAPPRRPDQLLRFPRPAQAQRRPRECRQSRPRAAAKLGG